jgi:hypothetical protein
MSITPSEEETHLDRACTESVSTYRSLLADRDRKIDAVRKAKGPETSRWKSLETDLRDQKEKSNAISAQLQRLSDGRPVSSWWFLLAALILAALEAPINKFMLDNILRGSNFESYIVSLFLTLMLLLLAHVAGQQARQIRGAYEETIYLSNIAVALVILFVLAACVGALTIGRAYYTIAGPVAGGKDIFSEIGRQVLTYGLWSAFVTALSNKAAFFLACLNTAGITAAFFTAFITHDSDKIYEGALNAAANSDRLLSKMELKYNRLLEKIAKKFGPKLSKTATSYGMYNAQLVALKQARGAPLSERDTLDITSLDTTLTAARAELASKRRIKSGHDAEVVVASPKLAENPQGVSRFKRERT